MSLEKHLSRMHRSPTDQPNMLIIPKKKEKKKKSRRDWDDIDGDNSQSSSSSESGNESSDSVKPLSVRVSRSGNSNSNTKGASKPPLKLERLQQNRVSTSPPTKVSENSIVDRRPGPKSKTSLLAQLEEDQHK